MVKDRAATPAQPLVGLLADLRVQAARHHAHPGALASVNALILAALIRLFASLQNLMELWQSGQCPPSSPSRSGTPRPSAQEPGSAVAPAHARAQRPRQTSVALSAAQLTAAASICAKTPSRAVPRYTPAHATEASATPSPRPPIYPRIRPPPWPEFSMTCARPTRNYNPNITITK